MSEHSLKHIPFVDAVLPSVENKPVHVWFQHGAIVMLYHPCADPAQVDMLRGIVTHCLRKHIITPYKQLPKQTPFALLSWGCKLTMSTVISSVARNFIKVRLTCSQMDILFKKRKKKGTLVECLIFSRVLTASQWHL